MLVLSRYPGETIVIGGEIIVTVLSVREDKVSLGVRAPKDVAVHRLEIHEKIQGEIHGQENNQ